jgi:hypothetical protein
MQRSSACPAPPDPVPDRGHREPLLHDAAARRGVPDPGTAPIATALCWSSIPVAATHTRSSPPWSLDEMARADPAASPSRGTNKASPPPGAIRTAENRPTGIRGSPASA